VDPNSWYGTLLKGIFNFSPASTKLEVIVWATYVVVVGLLFVRSVRRRTAAAQSPAPAAVSH
jgi:high-affinity iron transporter